MSTEIVKPVAKLLGQNGNVFNLLAICTIALKEAGLKEQAKELQDKVYASGSYDEALQLMMQYCEVE